MALPYDTRNPFAPTSPFSTIDPVLDQEIGGFLDVPNVNPGELPSFESISQPGDLAIDPVVEELDAQLAAEQSQGPADWTDAEAAKQRFEILAEAGSEPEPVQEGEIGGVEALPAPMSNDDLIAEQAAIAGVDGTEPGQDPIYDSEFGAGLQQNHEGISEIDLEGPAIPEEGPATIPELDDYAPEDLSDLGLATRALEQRQREDAERRRLENEAQTASDQRRAENESIRAEKRAEADKKSAALFEASEELAARSLDKDRYVNDMSLGQKAAGFFSILASGQLNLISGRGGNDSLDFFIGEINKDIDEQKANIDNDRANLRDQGSLVAKLYAQTGNSYQAAETARIATYQAAIGSIDNRVAQLNPEGSQAIEAEMQKRQLAAASEASRARVIEANRTQARLEAQEELDARYKLAQIGKMQHETAKLKAEADKLARKGTGQRRPKPKVGSVAEQEHLIATGYLPYKDENGLRIPAPGPEAAKLRQSGPEGETKEQAEIRNKRAMADVKEHEAKAVRVSDPSRKGAPLINEDKTPFQAPTPEEAKGIRLRMANAQKLQTTVDRVIARMEAGGGASEILMSDDYQALVSDLAKIDLGNAVAMNLGAISGDDKVFLVDRRGGADPTSFLRNATAGLKHMVGGEVSDVNTELRGMTYTGKEWKPVRTGKAPALESSTDDLLLNVGGIVPADIEMSKEERAKYIEDAAAGFEVAASRKEGRGKDYQEAIERLDPSLSESERITAGTPLVLGARSIAGRIGAIQELTGTAGLSKEQRLELRKNPEFMRKLEMTDKRLREAGAFKGAGFNALDAYKVVTGKKKDSK